MDELPMIIESTYKTPYLFTNPHIDTMYPYFFRKTKAPNYQRERIHLSDGDFLDLDYLRNNNDKLVILSHGLEGSSQSKYIQALAKYLFENSYDVLSWNCRGCSGEPNLVLRSYHSGVSYDLKDVVSSAINTKRYKELHLVGFSMGGNITLKYLGDYSNDLPNETKSAIAISTPLHLSDSADSLENGFNKIYSKHFIWSLAQKVKQKKQQFKHYQPDLVQFYKMNTIREFDNLFTAPLNSYKDANDYYNHCSSYFILDKIKVPTLIINAQNDPFLEGRCYPTDLLEDNKTVHLESPDFGGHVGFRSKDEVYWSERRVLDFIESGF